VGLPLYIFNVRREVKQPRGDLEAAPGSS